MAFQDHRDGLLEDGVEKLRLLSLIGLLVRQGKLPASVLPYKLLYPLGSEQ